MSHLHSTRARTKPSGSAGAHGARGPWPAYATSGARRTALRTALLLLLAAGPFACESTAEPPVVTGLEVVPAREILLTTEKRLFSAAGIDESGNRVAVPVRWHSSAPEVAAVSGITGSAIGISEGTAEIVATYRDLEARAVVRVDVTGSDIGPPPGR